MKNYLALLVLLSFIACKTTERSAAAERQNPSPNQEWLKAVNNDKWQGIYLENAVKIESDGNLINGSEAIISAIKQANWQIKTITTSKIIDTHRDSGYQYEIGEFTTEDGQNFHHLLIWNLAGEQPQRELEFIALGGLIRSSILVEIDQRRKEWIKLCNEHNAANLVEQLYSEDALYYNHKPLVKGREASRRIIVT